MDSLFFVLFWSLYQERGSFRRSGGNRATLISAAFLTLFWCVKIRRKKRRPRRIKWILVRLSSVAFFIKERERKEQEKKAVSVAASASLLRVRLRLSWLLSTRESPQPAGVNVWSLPPPPPRRPPLPPPPPAHSTLRAVQSSRAFWRTRFAKTSPGYESIPKHTWARNVQK